MARLKRGIKWFLVLFLGLLILPVVFNNYTPPPLAGPSLAKFNYQDIKFTNQQLDLAGMLFLPQGQSSYPLIIMIHGSGFSQRDNPWYLAFVAHLQANGIAVLLPDKRGSEQSAGSWMNAAMTELATDTDAALDFVIKNRALNPSKIGIMGLSQGGWIAPIVASERAEVNFVINVSGAATKAKDQLIHEEANTIHHLGIIKPLARAIAPLSAYSITEFRQKQFWQKNIDFDPMDYWRKVTIPSFIAYGELDEYDNVPIKASIDRLAFLLYENDAMIIKIYKGGGHAVQNPNTGAVQTVLLNDLVRFIKSS